MRIHEVQRGFTLIELMIVVTIIGILAALALPAYQNYTIRAHVAEGAALAQGAKAAMVEYMTNNAAWPSDNEAAGLSISTNIQSAYVSSVDVGTTLGQITVVFGNHASPGLMGKTLVLSATSHAGSIDWTCRGHGTIEGRYLPSTCR